jgi:CheY-like chemotaxis protein
LELCEQAAVEQDPAKLLELVKQINDLLSSKQQRLEQRKPLTLNGSASALTKSSNTRILFADDSAVVRKTIKTILIEQNPKWEICEAQSGKEALEKALSLRPDLVILDLNLPDIPGHEAARQIRQLSTATKIILCSLNDSAHLALMAQHAGADGYFTKGSSPSDLCKVIASALGQVSA